MEHLSSSSLKFSIFGNVFLIISLILASFVLIYQQSRISFLELTINTIGTRSKRSYNNPEGPFEYSVDSPPNNFEAMNNGKSQILNDDTLFFPLFTQISNATLERMCRQRFENRNLQSFTPADQQSKIQKTSADSYIEEQEFDDELKIRQRLHEKSHLKKISLMQQRKKFSAKYCSNIKALGPARLMGERLYKNGSAFRIGNQWFLTEYQSGYTLFQFSGAVLTRTQKSPDNIQAFEDESTGNDKFFDYPSNIYTLSEPFKGTDHTISDSGKGLVFYYEVASGDRIQAHYLESGKRITKLVTKSKNPLYGTFGKAQSMPLSSIDLERDHIALWAIYREEKSIFLTVAKYNPMTLKELKRWELPSTIIPERTVNAFISCGVFYAVHELPGPQNDDSIGSVFTLQVSAIYDFQNNALINGKKVVGEIPTMGSGTISNIQYDLTSDSLTYFDNGKIFSAAIQR